MTRSAWPIALAFCLLATVYSITVPIFEASDELWHYPMVQHIANHWTLPVQPLEPGASSGTWRQEASQPPLYYVLGAALTTWIDSSDMPEVRHLNPHVAAGEIRADRSNLNLVVHNPALERFPWQGTVLAVHLVRFLSVLLGTWSVVLTWMLVRKLFPEQAWLAPVSAAIHAFTPMHTFISASVNNDNLIVPLCTLALIQMVRIIKRDLPPWPPSQMGKGRQKNIPLRNRRNVPRRSRAEGLGEGLRMKLNLGIVLGLGLLTKVSALGLVPLVGAALFWKAWQTLRGQPLSQDRIARALRSFVADLGLVFLPAIAISGWWFYRNFRLYGDWLGLNAFYAVLGIRDVPANLAQLWSERFAFTAGYWGNFGGLNIPMPGWIYTMLNTVAVLALAGLLVRFAAWVTGKDTDKGQVFSRLWPFNWSASTAARALAWAWPAAVFVSWIRWAIITWSSQGRLIFSALPMWSLALALGLTTWISVYRERGDFFESQRIRGGPVAGGLAVLLFGLSAVALPLWIVPSYAPPAPLDADTVTPMPPSPQAGKDWEWGPNRVDITFGEALMLLGYHVETEALHPGEPVALTLTWQGIAPTPGDHSIFVHLLGKGGRIVAQRDSFPGRGLISTAWLEPGRVWAERYVIDTPLMAYTPDTLTVSVGVYETATGTRLPASGAADIVQGETAQFGAVSLLPRERRAGAHDIPNPVHIRFGKGMVLVSYELSDVVLDAGESLTVTLHWQGEQSMDENYTVSVQLIDAQWRKAAQSDAWPQQGNAPTTAWTVGQRVVDQRVLATSPDAPHPHLYDLRVAVYVLDEAGKIQHLPVVWAEGQMPAKAVNLTQIRIW